MRRIAFVGIENADSGILESALLRNLGPETEVKVFDRGAEPVAVAPFLVPKNKDTGKLDGSGSAVYIATDAPEALVKPLGRLAKAQVQVHTGWSSFEPEATDEAIRQWLADGTWPEAKADEDDMDSLLAELLLTDDEDEEDAAPEPVPAPERVSPVSAAPVPAAITEPASSRRSLREAPADLDPLDEALGAFEDHSEQQGAAFRGGRFDSMSPNDGGAPAEAQSAIPGRTAVIDEPLPDLLPPDSDDDDLPIFAPARSERALPSGPAAWEAPRADGHAEQEEDDLPLFAAGAAELDELPPFSPLDEPGRGDALAAGLGVGAIDDEDLPLFPGAVRAETPAPAARQETATAPSDDSETLPAFRPLDEGDLGDDGDDLPPFLAARQQSPVRPEATAADVDDDLPPFPGLGSLAAAPEPEEADDLPSFAPSAAPVRQRPRAAAPTEGLRARETDDDDAPSFGALPEAEEADDLPSFAPLRASTSAPVRTAAGDDDGDDLPSFTARVAAPATESSPSPADAEDENGIDFAFAPKVQTPPYAAPVEKRPEWGMRVGPDAVRYDRDNPQEVEREDAERRRTAAGYVQPVIDPQPHDRELKAAPGAADRRTGRVVAKAPANPMVEEPLDAGWAPEEPEDDFDPQAPAPYMEQLEPEARRAQSTMETIRREYDAQAVSKVRGKTDATVFYVTGAHGGAGKTTSTWMMANTVAAAIKKDPQRPVFLIEGDYENSKLAQRLNLPPEKNSGRLAEVFRQLATDRTLGNRGKMDMRELQDNIIEKSIYVNDHGVNIIAAPYDLTRRDGRFLRLAIQKSVEYAERRGGYVFIDADTLSNDDILDRTLAANATHVVMVSFGDQDHVDDTHRAIHTLTTPQAKAVGPGANGMGVPKDRIKLFFNKTGSERFEDLQQIMRPFLVEGHLPTVQGLNDGGWIGNLQGQDFLNAVTSYAVFLNRIHPMPELQPYQQRRPQKSTPRGGFLKVFGRSR